MHQHIKRIFIEAPTRRGTSGSPLESQSPKTSIMGNATMAVCKILIELSFLSDRGSSSSEEADPFLSLSHTTTERHPISATNPTPSVLGEKDPCAKPYASASANTTKQVTTDKGLFQSEFFICDPASITSRGSLRVTVRHVTHCEHPVPLRPTRLRPKSTASWNPLLRARPEPPLIILSALAFSCA
jgi:hypothetical protein